MNKAYKDLLISRIAGTVETARALISLSHKPLKGQLREILIKNLIIPFLPNDVGLGSGEIISADGKHSAQQDIIIYDKRILPPISMEQDVGIYPIESVLYTIEVKSILDWDGIEQSYQNAINLYGFPYMSGRYDEEEKPILHAVTHALPLVFAFSSRISDLDLVPKYEERYRNKPGVLRGICVVGNQYWFKRGSEWRTWKKAMEYDEVVAFIANILNGLKPIADSRYNPKLGHYLIGND